MKTLAIGAEAVVYADDSRKAVIKQRQPKKYRAKELDEKLRLHRMRREAKVIESLRQLGIPVPKLMEVDEKTATITMQLVEGQKVKDILSSGNHISICGEIGKYVGMMHSSNTVHGDLTTSNMIRSSDKGTNRDAPDCAFGQMPNCTAAPLSTLGSGNKVYFIDFGLSLFSNKDEDKAVDLHLFRQALSSSHSKIAEKCFAVAIAAYKEANSSGWKAVLNRLEKVEGRGRNKGKG
ncbi:Kae1-associated serine/threonine protein kinase [Candidatus Woesearchaeota archaeon]|nr:Kae1-associated serine/threonine protein kinase [Candidatus Woesearchaeota archaeon]